MTELLAVGVGGFVGSVARFWVSGVVSRWFNSGFPYGTLAVNVLGCMLLGGMMSLVEFRQLFGPHLRALIALGMLGGFTTFSTFGYETFALLRDNEYLLALGNVAANVVVGVLAVFAGWFLAKLI
jgi:fluoride exporter